MTPSVSSSGVAASGALERLRAQGFRISNGLSLLIIYLIVCVAFTILSPYFLTVDNFVNIGRTLPVVGIIAIGETLVLIAGGVDLSVGSVAALSGVVTGLLWEVAGLPIGLAALAGLFTGAFIGLINGVLVTRLRINPLISTLATFSIVRGLAFVLTNAQMNQLTHPAFLYLGRGSIAGIPVPFILMLVLFGIFIFVLRQTPFGRDLYAIGGNPMAARLAGIASRNNLLIVFILGGTSLAGGKGTLIGTFFGVIILRTLDNGLILTGVSSYYQIFARGAVLILAVGLDQLRTRWSARR